MEVFCKVPLRGGGVSASDLASALRVDERLLSEYGQLVRDRSSNDDD